MAVTALAVIGAKHAQPADQHGHLGHRKAEQRRAIEHHFLGFHRELLLAEIVAEGIGLRLHHREAVGGRRSEEHTSELQSLMRISYAVFCLKKQNKQLTNSENSYN